ncbi:MAG: hypothetical protein LBU99_00520 [Spirochaetaceae bacterium]|jgi:hypothetical protein|nr:hypothetical protein [Spirochaetaceae bacterium]
MKKNPAAGICVLLALLLLSCEPIEAAGGGDNTALLIESIYSIGAYTIEINFKNEMDITDSSSSYSRFAACFTANPKNTVADEMKGVSATLNSNRKLRISMVHPSPSSSTFIPDASGSEWVLHFRQDSTYFIADRAEGRKLEDFFSKAVSFTPEPLVASIAGLSTLSGNKLTLIFSRVLKENTANSSGHSITEGDFGLLINGSLITCTITSPTVNGSVFEVSWTAPVLAIGDEVMITFNGSNGIKDVLEQTLSADSLSISTTVPQ